MIPGPTEIRECSSCRKHIAQNTLISGNNYGAVFWTDGKTDAPMLPDQPWLVKCPHCGALLWIDEQTQVGEIGGFDSEPNDLDSETTDAERFADASPALTPTLEDYVGFLKAGVHDKQKERYVRLRAWWAGNDPRRESSYQSTPLDSFEIENLRVFITLLNETDDGDRLMKAEALRELGEFAAAEKLLAAKFAKQRKEAVSIIRDLNQKRITVVEEMKFK
ncbi:hypothetical protein [Candidatus Electronema sp. PJ]|uniref:hypothetical protein n=1 Tax=Candidatus Electronema sp. PJ TaxID=3401572 RepID=UPI003AA84690